MIAVRKASFALSGLALAGLACLALPVQAAVTYKAVTETTSSTGHGSQRMVVEARAEGTEARIEFKESDNPLAESGGYLVTKDGGKTLFMVNPKDKTYMRWDPEAMLKMAGGLMNGMSGLVKMEFSQPKVEHLLDEDGGTVAGVPTRHVQTRTSYSVNVRVLGMKNESQTETTQDVWLTRSLEDVALGVWLRKDPPRTGNPELDKLIAAQAGTMDGLPVKMVSVANSTNSKNGEKTTTRTTLEVTELHTGAPPAAPGTYDVPAGYKETEMLSPEGEDNPFARMMKQKGGGNR